MRLDSNKGCYSLPVVGGAGLASGAESVEDGALDAEADGIAPSNASATSPT